VQALSEAPGFEHDPLLVFYELTRACDLACAHDRARASAVTRHPLASEPDCVYTPRDARAAPPARG